MIFYFLCNGVNLILINVAERIFSIALAIVYFHHIS